MEERREIPLSSICHLPSCKGRDFAGRGRLKCNYQERLANWYNTRPDWGSASRRCSVNQGANPASNCA